MPLRRLLSTFSRTPSHLPVEDAVTTDAAEPTVTANTSPATLTPSRATNCSTSLGKRRHRGAPEAISQPLSSVTTPTADISTVATPSSRRPPAVLTPIDTTPIISAGPSSSHLFPPSPTPTEIAPDVEPTRIMAEDHMAILLAEGIKVRDFFYEPLPNSCKAPELFDPLPSLIAADWHMRNPQKNQGLLSGKELFRLVKLGWLSMTNVTMHLNSREFLAVAQYSERPEEERYPFVTASKEPMPTPSQRVRMRRNAGFQTYPDDLPDREFFGYDPTGYSDEEHSPIPPEAEAEAQGAAGGEAEAEEPKVKRRKVKAKTKTKPLRRAKPLRREYSRPEV